MAKIDINEVFMSKPIQRIIGSTCHKYCIEYDDRIRELGKTYSEVKEVLEQDSFEVFYAIMTESHVPDTKSKRKDFEDYDDTFSLDSRRIKYFKLYYERRLLIYVHRELDIHRTEDVGYKKDDCGVSLNVDKDDVDYSLDPEFDYHGPDFTKKVEDRMMIDTALNGVNASYREIISMEYIQDLDNAKICQVLSITENNRHTRRARAISAMLKVLDKVS